MENLFEKIKGDIDVDLNIQEGGSYYVFFKYQDHPVDLSPQVHPAESHEYKSW